ncbi:MAG: bacteriohemerythrin [Cellulosilyticum sp.]|nr:bacteriohemerythrin [Cellulosilyticum sp.]
MIKWDERYRLGIDIIDEQHKKLFEIAGEAEHIMKMPEHLDKYDEIVDIVNQLRDYVRYHFEQEEKMLFEIKYKKLFAHKVAHDDFIEYIYSQDLGEVDKNQTEGSLRLVNTLIDWLVEHVLQRDREWATTYISTLKENNSNQL